jgi:LacI family transcriptional regulator
MFSVENFYTFPRKSKATLKNVSNLLQISISTVFKALKDHPDIAEQTKKKVHEPAEIMDYEPNAFNI